MDTDGIQVDVADVADATVVTVAGELDVASAPALLRALEATAADSSAVVRMSGVVFMDSSGLHVLASQWRRFDAAGGSLRVDRPSPQVERLLNIAGLDRLIGPVRLAS